jgi:hypothetical protein
MATNAHQTTIQDPAEELRAVYEARIRPFADLGQTQVVARYDLAYEIAREHLQRARERGDDDAA